MSHQGSRIKEALRSIEELIYDETTERPFFGWGDDGLSELGQVAFHHIEALTANLTQPTPEQTK